MFESIKNYFNKNAKSNTITGIDEAPSMNSPQQPLLPVQGAEVSEAYGWDFAVGINRLSTPRGTEVTKFDKLRFLANHDLVRAAISKRKDQITKFGWKIVLKETGETNEKTKALTKFFKKPDREHRFDTWISMIIEEHLVLDAVTIFPQKTRGGEVYALKLIDGSTIHPLIDAYGFTPLDGSPAYQQLKGRVIVANWAYDEIIYAVKNKRVNSLYGLSVVEQLENTINLLYRKTFNQLDYFSKGNTPSLLISAPQGWGAEDIKKFQKMWNEMQKGITKYGMSVMIPSDKVHNTKPEALKNEFDEWLARMVCYHFSLPPTALMKDNNRATAETQKESAQEEGAIALLDWLQNLIQQIIEEHFGFDDVEFIWEVEEESDPLILSQIECAYVAAGIRTVDEVRADHGWKALPKQEEKTDDTQQEDDENGKPLQSKVFKKKTSKININDLEVVQEAQKELENILNKYFSKQKEEIIQYVSSIPLNKADNIEDDLELDQDKSFIEELVMAIKKYMIVIAMVSYKATLNYLGKTKSLDLSPEPIFHDVDGNKLIKPLIELPEPELKLVLKAEESAIDYSRRRSAELIGKRILKDGSIVDNPNAEYCITDTTRNEIKGLIDDAMKEGWSNQELANKIQSSYSFSSDRSMMIARTETNMADNNITVKSYEKAGIKKKKWLTAHDDKVDPCCTANEKQGAIALNAMFSSGSVAPPAHPRCRCTILAVFEDDDEKNDLQD